MADFATPEWIEQLGRIAATTAVDPALRLTIEQRITEPDPVAWHFEIADGALRVHAGEAAAPTVTLSCTREVAEAIHGGTRSAQRAFLDGALRIGGDLQTLLAHRAALATVAALMSPAA